jgi:predicted PurR-regulated permease PerM
MLTSKIISNGILRSIGILVAICLGLYLLYSISAVITYLFIALIVSMIASPIVSFLKNKLRFPHIAAVIVTLFFLISLLAGFIMLFVPLIVSQSENLSLLDMGKMQQNIDSLIKQVDNSFGIDTQKIVSESDLTKKLNLGLIPTFINDLLGILSGFGIGVASVIFISFFFLKDRELFTLSIKKILPDAHEEKILNSLRKINYMLSRYFIGLIIQMTVLFVCYLIVLLIFGVQNAFIIAFISAFLNIIPYIGPLIASVLTIVLTMLGHLSPETQDDMFSTTLYVFIGYCVAQFIDNNISTPLIFSSSTNSHPLEIFIVIMASGYIFGILGMVIAIPFYTSMKVIAKEFWPRNTVVRILTKDL